MDASCFPSTSHCKAVVAQATWREGFVLFDLNQRTTSKPAQLITTRMQITPSLIALVLGLGLLQSVHHHQTETSTFVAPDKRRCPINPNLRIFSLQKDTGEPRKKLSTTGRMDGSTNVMRNISGFSHRNQVKPSCPQVYLVNNEALSMNTNVISDMFIASYMHDVFFLTFWGPLCPLTTSTHLISGLPVRLLPGSPILDSMPLSPLWTCPNLFRSQYFLLSV